MTENMFCFQCEQTAKGTACTTMGVCGKTPEVANLQDELTVALVCLANKVQQTKRTPEIDLLILDGLFTGVTNVNFDEESCQLLINKVKTHAKALDDSTCYSVPQLFQDANEDIASLRSLLILGLRGMAAYAHHAFVLSYESDEVMDAIYRGLVAVGEEHTVEEWLAILMQFGLDNYKCMALLDQANTETYGHPEPTEVTTYIEKGPFIVVTGHDLHDIKQLLEQTKEKGINIYTHGEMLPTHSYPELKKYPHLKGHFGTAWQNQQKEFKDVPGAFLFTTNCLMPPKESYADRVFTTSVVQFPGTLHIKDNNHQKDFTPVIEKALALGGYSEEVKRTGINGGSKLLTGFGHHTVLSVADKVIDAVQAGHLKHIFLIGGCDGAKTGRNYFTELAEKAPDNTVVLTLGCGKFRLNDLQLGQIGDLPRLMDMGQCNDAFSAIKVAIALAEAFECDMNDLPLTLVLSWYEQKAVCVLLTLLALGVKGIHLGPTLPAFVSKNVLNVLVEQFAVAPISTPEQDLAKFLA